MRRLLTIAYHFPPYYGSSGNLRALSLCRYLPEHGWKPVVLTAHPRAYSRTDDHLLEEIPDGVDVHRAFAIDVRRHLALAGKYPSLFAQPDRWSSWWLGAVPRGLSMIRKYRPKAIWSTYPIATAHVIAYTLARLSGLPWVADFRDPMNAMDVQDDPLSTRARAWVERKTVRASARVVFTTPGAAQLYADRYADRPRADFSVVSNGYDERHFSDVPLEEVPSTRRREGPIRLVHSGHLYRPERDPTPFFAAIGELVRSGRMGTDELRVVLRASGHEDYYQERIAEQGIDQIVCLAPAIPYREALAEMRAADGVLLFQGPECNRQIPAKAYEYLRVQRPVFLLGAAGGDTAGLLESMGTGTIADMRSETAIANALQEFMKRVQEGSAPVGRPEKIEKHSRRARTAELARILDDVVLGLE